MNDSAAMQMGIPVKGKTNLDQFKSKILKLEKIAPKKTPLFLMEFSVENAVINCPFSTDLFLGQYIAVEECFSTPHTQPTAIGFLPKNILSFPLFH